MYVYRLTMNGLQSNVVQDVRITKRGNEYQNVPDFFIKMKMI